MQVSKRVKRRYPCKICSPGVQILMGVWYRIDLVVSHDRVRSATRPVAVEFFLEQFINSFIDVEWWAIGPSDFQPSVEPETSRALHKKLDFRTGNFISCLLSWYIRLRALPLIVICHRFRYCSS